MAVDFVGNELSVGDTVAFMQLGYRNLMLGTVEKITNCTLFITHEMTNTCSTRTKQHGGQVIRVRKDGEPRG